MEKKHSVIAQSQQKKKKEETYSYKGWIISDSFFKRMLAMLGYNFVATLFIYGVLIAIFIVIGIIGFLLSGLFG